MTTPIETTDHGHFRVSQYWYGYQSYDKDNKPLIYSASEEDCLHWTHRFLKAEQEGGWADDSRVVNDGKVGGKL